jgi:hypothetical protein
MPWVVLQASLGGLNVFFQLVGTALLVYVKTRLTAEMKRVEGASRKVSVCKPAQEIAVDISMII